MFAGLLVRNGAHVPRLPLLTILDPWGRADRRGVWQDHPFLLAQTLIFNTPESNHEQTPYCCPESGLVITAWARLDNRDGLARALGHLSLDETTDPMLILAAYRKWGSGCVARLLGDFAFAIADPGERRVFLARDPLGVRPLYYRLDEGRLVFATTAAVFAHIHALQAEPDPDWMARYLAGLSMSHTATAYRGVLKLAPGHWLRVGLKDSVLERYFWFEDESPPASRRDPEWVEAYRAVLEEAVRCRVRSAHPLGSENSGGLDSGSVTAFVAKAMGNPAGLHSFSFALADQEPEYILETSRRCGLVHNHLIANAEDDDDATLVRALAAMGYPQEHGNGTRAQPFYRLCALFGIRTLFSGFGGDESVTYSGGLLRFDLLSQRQWGALWSVLPGNPLARALRLAKTVARDRRPHEYQPGWKAVWDARWNHQILRPDVIQRLDLHGRYLETARHEAPFRRINDAVLSGHRLGAAFVPTRLENCTLMARSYGVDYHWPLLDVRLIQQYLSTPAIEKADARIGRYLHRRAVEGVVPPKVQWKPSKDMGYGKVIETMWGSSLKNAAAQARRDEACLHPAIEAMIDRAKFRAQIHRAEEGSSDAFFWCQFRNNARRVRWLNHWLQGGAPP